MAFWLGYTVSQEFEIEGAAFPPEAQFRAQLRAKADAADLLGEISTAAGTIERVSATVIRLTFPGGMTKDWRARVVAGDVARVDVAPPLHLNFQFEITFEVPVTRPAQ